MKKILLVALMLMFVFGVTSVYAQTAALGNSNLALKVNYLEFTDKVKDVELGNGAYIAIEGYSAVMPQLYLGMEIGRASTSKSGNADIEFDRVKVDVDTTFIPVELNLKYAIEASPDWVIGLCAGASYNYLEVEVHPEGFKKISEDKWLWGGQLFADVNYKMSDQWFIGINGKYKITEELEKGIDVKADNWQFGAQIGGMF